MTRADLVSKLTASIGAGAAAEFDRLALPTAHIALEVTSADSIPSTASRYGGDPDVPAGFTWPTCRTRLGNKPEGLLYPLTFVAQVNFAETAECLKDDPIWPQDGTLLFFFDSVCMPAGIYNPADVEGLYLAYVPRGTPMKRMKAPPHTPPSPCDASKFVLNARRMTFRPGWTMPEADSEVFNRGCVYDSHWWRETFKYGHEPYHRLGGYAVPEQSDPCGTCAESAAGMFLDASGSNFPTSKKKRPQLPESEGPWRLLLQFDLAAEPESPCGYGGTQFFVCASEACIRSRSFRAAWWSWDND